MKKGTRLIAAVSVMALAAAGVAVTRPFTTPAAPAQAPTEPMQAPAKKKFVRNVTFQSGAYRLAGQVLKPAGDGPFPAIVYNHGSEREPSFAYLGELAAWFRTRGFVFFVPYRRGASGSEGPYWKDVVDKLPLEDRRRAVVEQLDAENADVLAAISYIREQSYVDPTRVTVAGCSFGGIETVLAAEQSTAIAAAVDFAGASMAWASSAYLQERLRRAVRGARVPIFFIQAENDFDITPSLALAAEMDLVHKPHALRIYPAHGTTHMEGHGHFCTHGMSEWGQDVLAFLRESNAGSSE